MLIRSLRAENFMGFGKLEISQLPERGLIGIEGPNESGKTSVGDAILFALFGKSPRNDALPVSKLIRWKTDALNVELCFAIPGEGEFFIHREIDKYGTNYVKLLDAGSKRELAAGHVDVARTIAKLLKTEPDEFRQAFFLSQHRSLARGLDPDFLDRVIGVSQLGVAIAEVEKEVEELERSYSLYNKDIDRNRLQLEKYDESIANEGSLQEKTLKFGREVEVGKRRRDELEVSLKCLRNFGEELARRGSQIESARGGSVQNVAKALGGLPALYRAFEDRCGSAEREAFEWTFLNSRRDRFDQQKELCSSLADFSSRFCDLRNGFKDRTRELARKLGPDSNDSLLGAQCRVTGELAEQTRTCQRRSIRAFCVLVAAGLLGAIWGSVLSGMPHGQPVVEFLGNLGVGAENASTVLGSTFGGLAMVFFLFVVARGLAGAQRHRLEEEESNLAKEIRDSRAEADALEAALAGGQSEEISRAYAAVEKVSSATLISVKDELAQSFEDYWCVGGDAPYRKKIADLCASQKRFREEIKQEAQGLDKLIKDLSTELTKKKSEKGRIDGRLREAVNNKPKREKLAAATSEFREKSNQIRSELTLRRVSIQLLEETSTRVRSRVAPTVAEFVRRILPTLTEDRYRDARLSDDWNLEIFASEKSDFMDYSELSGGTRESLRLALVLAACQCLIHCRALRKHFLFLDEPFTLIDAGRARSILECLKRLSPEVQQVFVIQPAFDAAQLELFDETIRIKPDSESLVWTGRSALVVQESAVTPTDADSDLTPDASANSSAGDESGSHPSSSLPDSPASSEEGAPNPPSWAVRR